MAKYVKRASYLWAGVAYLWLRMLRCRAEKCDANAQNNGAMGVSVQGEWVRLEPLFCFAKNICLKLQYVFVSNCEIYSSQIAKFICINLYQMHLSECWNIFDLIFKCIC